MPNWGALTGNGDGARKSVGAFLVMTMTLRSAKPYCFANCFWLFDSRDRMRFAQFAHLTHLFHYRLDVGAPGYAFANYLHRRIHDLGRRQALLARFASATHVTPVALRIFTTLAGRSDTSPCTCVAQRSNAARFSSA